MRMNIAQNGNSAGNLWDLERMVDFLVGGIGPEGVLPEGRLHGGVEGLDPGAVLLGAGLVEGEGGEEAAGVRVSSG
jgi:hypothetical protein